MAHIVYITLRYLYKTLGIYMYKGKHQLLYLSQPRVQNQYYYLRNTFQLKITRLPKNITGKEKALTS